MCEIAESAYWCERSLRAESEALVVKSPIRGPDPGVPTRGSAENISPVAQAGPTRE